MSVAILVQDTLAQGSTDPKQQSKKDTLVQAPIDDDSNLVQAPNTKKKKLGDETPIGAKHHQVSDADMQTPVHPWRKGPALLRSKTKPPTPPMSDRLALSLACRQFVFEIRWLNYFLNLVSFGLLVLLLMTLTCLCPRNSPVLWPMANTHNVASWFY